MATAGLITRRWAERRPLRTECGNEGEFFVTQWEHGEAALPEEGDIGEGRLGFDLGERDGARERADGFEFDGNPTGLLGGGVGKRGARNLGETDDGFGGNALVEKHTVTGLHRVQMDTRLVVADAGPRGAAIADEVDPRVGFGFGFYEPVLKEGVFLWFHGSGK